MSKIEFHEITLDDKHGWMPDFRKMTEMHASTRLPIILSGGKYIMLKLQKNSGCAIIRFEEEGVVMYSYPIGAGDRRKVIDELRTICEEEKRPLIMSPLSEADREQMLTWYSEQF